LNSGSGSEFAARGLLERVMATNREGRVSERGKTTTEAVAKRRLRSLKRETGGGRKDVLAKRSKRKA
jgi:hypothetical protein